ncbi:hypothetical protein [uncultured Erythrobacter sp.]|uniref:hypothetical protein n=1 Tax=uncultured Erythrobacter sp. TaxID=263913 RepID=UPI002658D0DA|nr:hypothetical protein [uncultured Erythrobacter sp.]
MLVSAKNLGAILSAILTLQTPERIEAQDIPTEMAVIIERDDEAWRKCGLSLDSIEGATKSSLRFNRIAYTEDKSKPFVWIAVTTLPDGLYCTSNISITIERFDKWPKPDGTFHSGSFVYCSTNTLLTGTDHGSRVLATIRSQIDTCLGKISTVKYGSLDRIIDQMAGEDARAKLSE